MRILHACLTYHPAVGGADLFVRRIAEGMAARGHEVTVLASDLEEHVRFRRLPPAWRGPREVDGVRVERCMAWNLPGHVYPIMPAMARRLARPNADVVHAHSWGYFPVDAAAAARRLGGPPLVVIPHGARPGYWPALRRLARAAEIPDRVLPNSRFEADDLLRLGVPADRVEILGPGVDLERFAAGRRGAFDAVGWGGAPVVLFVGRVAEGKGVDVLLDAFARLRGPVPEARLAVVGPDYGARAALEARARGLGLAETVRFLGAVADDALPGLYASAAAFCLPSRYEAFGIVLAEAMAAGVPVVATDAGAIAEVLGGAGIVVPVDDAEALARGLRTLLSDARAAAALREAGTRRAAAFGWKGILDRLERVYADLAGAA